MATEQDLIQYLSAHAEQEQEEALLESERQLRRRNLLEFLRFPKEKASYELTDWTNW
jgi:hypothetical protein